MTLLQMPEDMAMAAVDAAAATGQPMAFYCYTPHHMFKLHDIVQLTEPKYDPAKWHIVMPSDDPDWLTKSEAPVAWDASRMFLVAGSVNVHHDVASAIRLIVNTAA